MVILIHKPAGITSFDVIRQLRRKMGIWKMGHAGTLDPAASGLLIIGTDNDTKKLTDFLKLEKEYVAEVELGKVSNTYDREGEVKPFSGPFPSELREFSREEIEAALEHFRGEIMQMPPAFSAKKIKGVPAYKLARKGEAVTLEPKKVTISKIEILAYTWPMLNIRVTCSSGTYVRSLAHDLGQALGCGGYLASLVRTRIGNFCLEDAQLLTGHEAFKKTPN